MDVLRLARDLLLELAIAHHLSVRLHLGGDLLLLGGGNHAARIRQVREAHRQNPEKQAAGHCQSERQAERARGRIHAGGFTDPLLGDGRQGEVVELRHQQTKTRARDQERDHEVPPGVHSRDERNDGRNSNGAESKPDQHDIGWPTRAGFATGEHCHPEHGEGERCEGKTRLHGVVLQGHLQKKREGDHGTTQGDLLQHLLRDADPKVQVFEQIGVQERGLALAFAPHEPEREQGQCHGPNADDQTDVAAAFLPHQDAEDNAPHADDGKNRTHSVYLAWPGVGDVLDEADLGQHHEDDDHLEAESHPPRQVRGDESAEEGADSRGNRC